MLVRYGKAFRHQMLEAAKKERGWNHIIYQNIQ